METAQALDAERSQETLCKLSRASIAVVDVEIKIQEKRRDVMKEISKYCGSIFKSQSLFSGSMAGSQRLFHKLLLH